MRAEVRHEKMKAKRKYWLCVAPVLAALVGHVFFGTTNLLHPDQAPPALWQLSLLLGLLPACVFGVFILADSVVCRARRQRTALYLDLTLCIVATGIAFAMGIYIKAI